MSRSLEGWRGMSRSLKVLSVFGTRPEANQMAPVVRELERRPDRLISRVCVTAPQAVVPG